LELLKTQVDSAVVASKKNAKVCRHCYQTGHLLPKCPIVECRQCRKKGHIAKNCSTVFCRYCKKSDHFINDCPTRPQNRNQTRPSLSTKPVFGSAACANNSESSPSSSIDLQALLSQLVSATGNNTTTLATLLGNSSWYFDSGCCNHMTSCLDLFLSLATAANSSSIKTANGSILNISYKGPISSTNVSLPDTFLIPALNFNLVSVGQLCDYGYELNFSPTGSRVQDLNTGQIIRTGSKVGRLFELTSLHVPSSTPICAISTSVPLSIWHQRLGHSSLNKLRPLLSHGVLGSANGKTFNCIACQQAK